MTKKDINRMHVIPAKMGIQRLLDPRLKRSGMTALLSALILVFFLTSMAQAEESYVNRSAEKLGRGVFNIVFSPLEISKAMESELKEGQPFKMVTLGPAKGVLKTVQRILVGSYEMVTFLVPQDPILNPPYITPSIDEFTKEQHEQKKDGVWGGLYPK